MLGQAFDAHLVDRVQFYLAPIMTGGPVVAVAAKGAASTLQGARLEEVQHEQLGRDLLVTGRPRWVG